MNSSSKTLVIHRGLSKRAADAGQQPDFEEQFGILTSSLINEKFPELAKHQILAQTVEKNDSNTEAMGIVLYMLNGTPILIPAIFRNNQIATNEMMYIPGMDLMQPLSEAKLAWVKGMKPSPSGEEVKLPAGVSKYSPGGTYMKETYDPLMKSASAGIKSGGASEDINILEYAVRYGKKACRKFADMLHDNTDILNGLLRHYSVEDVLEFTRKTAELNTEKPREDAYELVTVHSKRAAELSEDARGDLVEDGFVVMKKDNLKEYEVATDVLSVKIYNNFDGEMTTATCNCKCVIVDDKGKPAKGYILKVGFPGEPRGGRLNDFSTNASPFFGPMDDGPRRDGDKQHRVDTVFIPYDSTNKFRRVAGAAVTITASMEPFEPEIDRIGRTLESLGSGEQPYYWLDTGTVLIAPNSSVIALGGNFQRKEAVKNVWHGQNGSCTRALLYISSDPDQKGFIIADTDIIAPQGTRAVVPDDAEGVLGPVVSTTSATAASSLLKAYIADAYTKVKVTSAGETAVLEFTNGDGYRYRSGSLTKGAAALKLCNDFGTSPKDAREILKAASEKASFSRPRSESFYISKKAQQYDPEFKSADLGYEILADRGPTKIRMKPEPLSNREEQQFLSEIKGAVETGIKEVVDASVFKLLVQASDPVDSINDSTKDFMLTLDKLCRLLFQFEYHIDRMEEEYGISRLNSMREAIKNSISSLSELSSFLETRKSDNGVFGSDMEGAGLQSSQML